MRVNKNNKVLPLPGYTVASPGWCQLPVDFLSANCACNGTWAVDTEFRRIVKSECPDDCSGWEHVGGVFAVLFDV